MSEVDEALENLIAAIRRSDTFREYQKQLELVKNEPGLKNQVDDFRRKNYEMQCSDGLEFDRLYRFEQEFQGFRENPLVDNFLAAELDFCRMLQQINFHLTESVDFE